MQHKRTITIFILGALAVALTIGAVAFRTVSAASPTTTSTITSGSSLPTGMKWVGGSGPHGGYDNQDLADALGITTDALNTAYQAAYAA
ncbi:MAG TPA: hypothetical protein VLD65_10410, partial [Anaerolineales bacterium]|nr:hypothetical protein [Anaerolineales bacterium]